jgi:hypothetical protein
LLEVVRRGAVHGGIHQLHFRRDHLAARAHAREPELLAAGEARRFLARELDVEHLAGAVQAVHVAVRLEVGAVLDGVLELALPAAALLEAARPAPGKLAASCSSTVAGKASFSAAVGSVAISVRSVAARAASTSTARALGAPALERRSSACSLSTCAL